MTDVRQTSATIVLGDDLEGRFFVRNAQRELIVELFKPRGRRVELGVEPAAYEIRVEIQRASLIAKAEVAEGGRVALEPKQFGPAAVEATRRRGVGEAPNLAVDGRNRISIRWGMWRTGDRALVTTGAGAYSGPEFGVSIGWLFGRGRSMRVAP